MNKAFCLVAIPASGAPLSQAGTALGPLVDAAKASRVSGEFDGQPVREVFVLASTAIGPVCHYRCAAAPVKKPKVK